MFHHEKLNVYQKTIAFIGWTQPIIESIPAKISARDQLDRASTSIALNIAEGNAKFSIADRARYFQIAHGSAVESAACLDVLVARKLKKSDEVAAGKVVLEEIVRMVLGLLDRLGCRIAEDAPGGAAELISDSKYPAVTKPRAVRYSPKKQMKMKRKKQRKTS